MLKSNKRLRSLMFLFLVLVLVVSSVSLAGLSSLAASSFGHISLTADQCIEDLGVGHKKNYDFEDIGTANGEVGNVLPSDFSSGVLFGIRDSVGKLITTIPTPVSYNETYYTNNSNTSQIKFNVGLTSRDTLKMWIRKCCYDASGDLCDVFLTISVPEAYGDVVTNTSNAGRQFDSAQNHNMDILGSLQISEWRHLLKFNFGTTCATCTFSMKYFKAGTVSGNIVPTVTPNADIEYSASTFGDVDVLGDGPQIKSGRDNLKNHPFKGNEGIYAKQSLSAWFYDKNSYLETVTWKGGNSKPTVFIKDDNTRYWKCEGGLLRWYNGSSTGYNIPADSIGVAANRWGTMEADSKGAFTHPAGTDGWQSQTSAVLLQKIDTTKHDFEFTYSGTSCGIGWFFASPYSFDLPTPEKYVSEKPLGSGSDANITSVLDNKHSSISGVHEGEEFTYILQFYVPANNLSSELNFISDASSGKYGYFHILDELGTSSGYRNGIMLAPDSGGTDGRKRIIVLQDDDKNVTNKFAILTDNDKSDTKFDIQMAPIYVDGSFFDKQAKADNIATYKKSNTDDFYGHQYTILIPAKINKGTGKGELLNNFRIDYQSPAVYWTKYSNDVSVTTAFKSHYVYRVDDDTTISEDYNTKSVAEGNVSAGGKHGGYFVKNTSLDGSSSTSAQPYRITRNTDNPCTDNSNKITFRLFPGYNITGVEIDGSSKSGSGPLKKVSTTSDYTEYTYTFSTTGESKYKDIEHRLHITTAKKQAHVITHYVDDTGQPINVDDTGQSIDDTDETQEWYSSYTTTQKSFTGYKFKEIKPNPAAKSGTVNKDKIEVTYVYTKTSATVTTKYVTKGLIFYTSIHDPLVETYNMGAHYTTTHISIPGYTYKEVKSDSDPVSGTVSKSNTVVTYVYTKNSEPTEPEASLRVRYIDEYGFPITPDITKTGKVGDAYTTEEKTFPQFELTRRPNNPTGNLVKGETVVTYVYKAKDVKVTAKYIDTDGNTLHPDVVQNMRWEWLYETEQKSFPKYDFVETQGDPPSGRVESDSVTVTYVYAPNTTTVRVRYVTDTGTELTKDVVQEYSVGDSYTTDERYFEGYVLKQRPSNATGMTQVDETVVTYVYIAKDAKVIAKYIDTNNKSLHDDVTYSTKWWRRYVTTQMEFGGYAFKETQGDAPNGTVNKDVITVTYIYQPRETQVIVKWVDVDGEDLAPSVTKKGLVFDPYETEAKTFDGYKLTEMPGNAKGEMQPETITVTYVYDLSDTALPSAGTNIAAYGVYAAVLSAALASTIVIIIKRKHHKDA